MVLAQNWLNFTIIPGLQTPYPEGVAHVIPGRLEFEDYDYGGQNTSYFDTSTDNAYGDYRLDDVEILPSQDTDDGFAVYAEASEWLEYTCDILPGTYTVTVRSSSSQAEQTLTLSQDGQTLTTFSLPTTGGFYNWQDTTIAGINIPGGSDRTLAFNLDTSTAMLNYVEFVQN
ncbi:MAG: carbohydrate-binding domain-containing protein [Planctomycetota bacterium]